MSVKRSPTQYMLLTLVCKGDYNSVFNAQVLRRRLADKKTTCLELWHSSFADGPLAPKTEEDAQRWVWIAVGFNCIRAYAEWNRTADGPFGRPVPNRTTSEVRAACMIETVHAAKNLAALGRSGYGVTFQRGLEMARTQEFIDKVELQRNKGGYCTMPRVKAELVLGRLM